MPLFGAPANSAAIYAGGIKFYLVGRMAAPAGTVVNVFQNAMVMARTRLALVHTALSANPPVLTAAQNLALTYCFNPTPAQLANTITTIRGKLGLTLAGLRTAQLYICEPDAAAIAAGAEGYVTVVFGTFRGHIHTRFNLPQDRTAFNLIHEGTHKFANTVDNQYIGNGVANYLALGALGIYGNSPISNVAALTNADSYAGFVMHF
jgi:hypothetical protein